jgi:hypothetical protein
LALASSLQDEQIKLVVILQLLRWQPLVISFVADALARESQKAGFAQDIANRVFGATVAPDLEFGRQREAAMFAAGPLGERQLALDVEGGRREMGSKGLCRSQEASPRTA